MEGRGDLGKGGTLAGQCAGASVEPAWRSLLAGAVRDPDELWRLLALPADQLPAARRAAAAFPLLVPRGFLALIEPGRIDDPLLRQVLPLGAEGQDPPGFSADPLHEDGFAAVPGLIRKYASRALLVTTGACAVHCRYCFRREFPYQGLPRGRRWWAPALAWLAAHPEVDEVLLSGGDPLSLPDSQLAALAADLAAIPHLRRLRLHTRLPVVLPERVDERLLAWLGATRLRPVVVIHANHPRELAPAVVAACARLRAAGATLLNQSVLLAGVNDDAAVLAGLSLALFDAGVLPYYLHALDRVRGAGHFLVEDDPARALAAELAARLPGYLVPRLVREEPGRPHKVPV
ncbi:MAG: EF-P beta-lysylation protein EpmB [Planctomycetes bacterium]|nr:EF-P beta-lysylation protein EpmB [Planctomycetota bacterium]